MASYNLKFNSDDSVIRHIIIGLLADLNNKVYFHRQLDNNTRVTVDIPFYYSITGDDQFLRDHFLFTTASGPDCHPDKGFADGNYDQVPRGVVNLTSVSIDSGKLVNKRNQGNYTKMNSEGAMEGYMAEFEAIPLTIGFDVEILVSSTLDALKITEMIIKRLYKSNYYNVEVGHLNEGTYRLPAYYAMPDDYDIQRPLDFTFDDKENYKITLPIEVNTHIPTFEWETETHLGNRMYEIINNIIPSIDNNGTNGDKITIDNNGVTTNPEAAQSIINPPTNNILNIVGTNKSYNFVDGSISSNLIINSDSDNVESTLIAINDDVTISSINFPGIDAITILENGSITIKKSNDVWYVVSEINSNISYNN